EMTGWHARCTAGSGRTVDRPNPSSAPTGRPNDRICTPGAHLPPENADGSFPCASGPGRRRLHIDPPATPREVLMKDELERLYQTTYASVVRFLYRKVWDADRAEDLAQEVFIRAMAHRPEK